MDTCRAFAARLNRALDARGYPPLNRGRQVQLANAMGVSSTTAANWLNGVKLPSMANMAALAHLLGVAVDWLAHGAGDMVPPAKLTPEQEELLRIFAKMSPTQRAQFLAVGRVLGVPDDPPANAA